MGQARLGGIAPVPFGDEMQFSDGSYNESEKSGFHNIAS
jgi:hypothetical protein